MASAMRRPHMCQIGAPEMRRDFGGASFTKLGTGQITTAIRRDSQSYFRKHSLAVFNYGWATNLWCHADTSGVELASNGQRSPPIGSAGGGARAPRSMLTRTTVIGTPGQRVPLRAAVRFDMEPFRLSNPHTERSASVCGKPRFYYFLTLPHSTRRLVVRAFIRGDRSCCLLQP